VVRASQHLLAVFLDQIAFLSSRERRRCAHRWSRELLPISFQLKITGATGHAG
jgi:hypothetical protein